MSNFKKITFGMSRECSALTDVKKNESKYIQYIRISFVRFILFFFLISIPILPKLLFTKAILNCELITVLKVLMI